MSDIGRTPTVQGSADLTNAGLTSGLNLGIQLGQGRADLTAVSSVDLASRTPDNITVKATSAIQSASSGISQKLADSGVDTDTISSMAEVAVMLQGLIGPELTANGFSATDFVDLANKDLDKLMATRDLISTMPETDTAAKDLKAIALTKVDAAIRRLDAAVTAMASSIGKVQTRMDTSGIKGNLAPLNDALTAVKGRLAIALRQPAAPQAANAAAAGIITAIKRETFAAIGQIRQISSDVSGATKLAASSAAVASNNASAKPDVSNKADKKEAGKKIEDLMLGRGSKLLNESSDTINAQSYDTVANQSTVKQMFSISPLIFQQSAAVKTRGELAQEWQSALTVKFQSLDAAAAHFGISKDQLLDVINDVVSEAYDPVNEPSFADSLVAWLSQSNQMAIRFMNNIGDVQLALGSNSLASEKLSKPAQNTIEREETTALNLYLQNNPREKAQRNSHAFSNRNDAKMVAVTSSDTLNVTLPSAQNGFNNTSQIARVVPIVTHEESSATSKVSHPGSTDPDKDSG